MKYSHSYLENGDKLIHGEKYTPWGRKLGFGPGISQD